MELIVSLKSVDMYNQVSSFVDGIVLGCDYSFYSNNRFRVSEIKSFDKESSIGETHEHVN